MDNTNLLKFKGILLEIKESLKLQKVDTSAIFSEKLPDVVDQSVDDAEKSLNSRFVSRKNLYLKKIDEALAEIENETYGICKECGDELELSRLLARPTATLCIFCKAEKEKLEKMDQQKSGFLRVWEDEK